MAKAYGNVNLFITTSDGEKGITQAQSFSITFDGAKMDVNTFSGLVGFFTGTKKLSGSFNVVKSPLGDEIDFEKLTWNPAVVQMVVEGYGNKSIIVKECWFEKADSNIATESPTSLSVTWKGVYEQNTVS